MWNARREQEWKAGCLMFVDATALLANSEEELQELVRVFGYLWKKKLKVNVCLAVYARKG